MISGAPYFSFGALLAGPVVVAGALRLAFTAHTWPMTLKINYCVLYWVLLGDVFRFLDFFWGLSSWGSVNSFCMLQYQYIIRVKGCAFRCSPFLLACFVCFSYFW